MHKKYIKEQQLGNKGEAFFENLFSEHALVHKIDRSKDMGLDFLCEWVHGESPSQLMFGVQVKTRSVKGSVRIRGTGVSRLNALPQYKINVSLNINRPTLEYWRGFDFPIFLFLICPIKNGVRVFYKRFTPILHRTAKEGEEHFYGVNKGNKLSAFEKKQDGRSGGFCRDLYIDHLRCQHNKGMLTGIDPQDLGLKGYRKGELYSDVLDKYKSKIKATLEKYKGLNF